MNDLGSNLAGRIFAKATAAGWDDRTALCEGTRCLTYSELASEVGRGASVLSDLGLTPGERVAVYSPDCLEASIAILAILYSGAIVVPISELSAVNDLRNRLNNCGASVVIVHDSLHANVSQLRAELPGVRDIVSFGSSEASGPGLTERIASATAVPCRSVDDDTSAILLYSAGASNESNAFGLRGVLHNHSAPVLAHKSFALGFLSMGEEDRVFSTVRLSTAYGLGTGLLFPLLSGAQVLLLPEQAHSGLVFDALVSFKPTIFAATPSLYGQLARDATEAGHAKILSDVRWCIAGAEDMPPQIIAMVRGVLGSNVTVGYGLTEAFQFVIAGEAAGRRPGNCGQILGGFEVRIVDDEGKIVGEDEIGTLELRSDSIVNSYWGSNVKLEEDDGWFTTLDRFMVGAEGNYYHCGRVDNLFKVGGKWVAPDEVERALLANESVWECAVIGADDEDGLIKPFAFIVPNIGQTPGAELEAELRDYVKNELAPYKYPRWIEFIDELPKGSSGIILRYKLRDRLKQSRGRRRAETRTPPVSKKAETE
ncbi:MAG: AMP-binding protein [Kofleriaceae bacterium]|nr:AMP-binding protein [Kofleriaceae bacterium]